MHNDDRDQKYAALLENLAQEIQKARREGGTSRRRLAADSGLSERFIADVEKGNANPSLRSMFELGHALALDVPSMLSRQTLVTPRLGRLLAELDPTEQAAIADLLEARRAAKKPGRRITLLGMRGAGKTTVGHQLARELGCAFVEIDALIEEQAGMSLAQIFEIHGEPYYRRLEREVVAVALQAPGDRVFATGGGLVKNTDAYEMLRGASRTVWLKARPAEYLARVLGQGDRRPMERRPHALSELKALLAAREPEYEKANLAVDTTDVAPDEVVEKIASWLRCESK